MKNNKLALKFRLFLLIISFIFLFLNSYFIFKYNFLNFKNFNYIFVVLNFIFLLVVCILSNKFKKTTIFASLFYIFVSFFIFLNIYRTVNFFNKSNSSVIEYTMSVAVRKDSSISKIEDVTDKMLLAPFDSDKENINKLLEKISKEKNISLNVKEGKSYISIYNSLIKQESDIIILNSIYENILELYDKDYKDKIKKIYEFKIVKDKKNNKDFNNKENTFNIYISGIDTYGEISTVSRSDVNMIVTVNTNTNKILLTTIPRDSYVKIAEGGNDEYDKLTHSGVYGINASVKTLENLLDTKINYYARVNFTSFLKLIDLVGEIEVYNDQAFKSLHGNYDFPVGVVKLDSKKALGFVRERYSLQNGDGDRGKNQQKVIAAIIKKLTTFKAVTNYEKIIAEMSDAVDTDVSINLIMNIVNKKIDNNANYEITMQQLTGVGVLGLPSYAMPDYKLYMLKLDEESVQNANKNIENILKGQ